MLRKAALLTLAIGAAAAVGLMLYTGRRNPSTLLMAMFAIWVLAPFGALALAEVASKEWSELTRTALYALMLVITADTLAAYGYVAFGPSRPQPAFTFLVVPPASVVFSAIVLRTAAAIASRRSRSVVIDR